MTTISGTTGATIVGANGALGSAYGLGFIGALVYYIQAASSLLEGIFGVFQALFWPAFLVYEALVEFAA